MWEEIKKLKDLSEMFDLTCVTNYFAGQFGNKVPVDESRNIFNLIVSSSRKNVVEKIARIAEKMKQKHEIDMELYNDSGGGEMCIHCGKQGYLNTKESCDDNVVERNQVLADLKHKLNNL